MDRPIVYVNENLLDTDFLSAQRYTMIALGMALQAVLGTSTVVDGLACTPTGPASLQVYVGPGSIYSVANVDSTAYGSLALDNSHQIVKQGINLGTLTLNCPPPATTGYSINYLIEAAFAEVDTGSTVLPYYNSSNPSVAYSGPGGLGTSQNTVRQGQCVVTVKAGVAATTGSQVTPAVDGGYVALWVVTVANGQTQITSSNIVAASGAPFLSEKLANKISQSTGDARYLQIGNAPIGVVGLARNAKMSITSASATATFTADEIIVESTLGGASYKLANYNKAINIATTGAGGMDTGTAPVSGYVALYAIYNPTTLTTSSLATNATSAAAPNIYGGANMPSGYTASALISVWPTNASGQFIQGVQNDRSISFASINVLSTTSSQSSYASLSIASAAPLNAKMVSGSMGIGASSSTQANLSIAADGSATGSQQVNVAGATTILSNTSNFQITFRTPQVIYWSNNGTSGTITSCGISVSSYTI